MRTEYPEIVIRKSVETITVNRGETLTVYLAKGERCAIQVELRISKRGKAEIYCDELEVTSFEKWKEFSFYEEKT